MQITSLLQAFQFSPLHHIWNKNPGSLHGLSGPTHSDPYMAYQAPHHFLSLVFISHCSLAFLPACRSLNRPRNVCVMASAHVSVRTLFPYTQMTHALPYSSVCAILLPQISPLLTTIFKLVPPIIPYPHPCFIFLHSNFYYLS